MKEGGRGRGKVRREKEEKEGNEKGEEELEGWRV